MMKRLVPFALALALCTIPAAAADRASRQSPPAPIDADVLTFLQADEIFASPGKVVACSEVDLSGALGGRAGAQPKAACTVSLTCPDGATVRTCTSAAGACSAKCGFVKCDGTKHFCPTPCCERSITCPDGTPISCQAFGGNQCSQTTTSVTCNGETISCPFNCENFPFSPVCQQDPDPCRPGQICPL